MALSFQDIEKSSPFPRGSWEVNVGFAHTEKQIEHFEESYQLDLDPDFQRPHVWTSDQQSAFVEYLLQGGPSGRVIYFGCPGWQTSLSPMGPMVIVDGKQRLEAVRAFMRNELKVCGYYKSEIKGVLRSMSGVADLRWNVADADRATTLRWYLALNSAGTQHTKEELEKVRGLLAKVDK
jgi:hypothetical protein